MADAPPPPPPRRKQDGTGGRALPLAPPPPPPNAKKMDRAAMLAKPVDPKKRVKLLEAAKEGETDALAALLEAGVPVDAPDEYGCTALYWASALDHPETVRELLAAGANVHRTNELGNSALLVACRAGHVDVARLLLDAGASPALANMDGERPGDVACSSPWAPRANRAKIADALARAQVPEAQRVAADTLANRKELRRAARDGRAEDALALVLRGVDINSGDELGNTPLMLAAERDHADVARALLDHGADAHRPNAHGNAAGDVAGGAALRAMLPRAAATAADAPETHARLHDAAYHGDLEVVAELLRLGASADCQDADGCTPLRTAALMGHAPIALALLDAGASVDLADSNGFTPLYQAAFYGRVEAVRVLVKAGAAIDSRDAVRGEKRPIDALSKGFERKNFDEEHKVAIEAIFDDGPSA